MPRRLTAEEATEYLLEPQTTGNCGSQLSHLLR